jgi:excisionase family DNA binding protein
MQYNFKDRSELAAWNADNTVTTGEAAEILGCSRQNIADLISRGKLIPIKDLSRDRLFFKDDILSRKPE